MTSPSLSDWPVLKSYDQNHLDRIALPLGGIGTGTVSLGGRGELRDWEIVNRPAKGFGPEFSFFALRAKQEGSAPIARILEGQLNPPFDHERGYRGQPNGLPRFRECRFEAAYPFGQVILADPDVPVRVRIRAFNPLIPTNADESGLPVAILRYVLENTTDLPVEASVCGSLQNFIGTDGSGGQSKKNVNETRSTSRLKGVFLSSNGVDTGAEQWGTMSLATLDAEDATCLAQWDQPAWPFGIHWFWKEFKAHGYWNMNGGKEEDTPHASVSSSVELQPGESRELTFLITWSFPNRFSWSAPKKRDSGCDCTEKRDRIGNHYGARFKDAWAAAEHVAENLDELERKTIQFVQTLCESDLPEAVIEASLNNLTALRTQTSFRTPDGRFFGWEGSCDCRGCCMGSCTHVWNYEQATAYLFGDLSKMMRDTEFAHATDDRGLMSFRVNLPLERAREYGKAAADGQMGCIMKLYRDWQLSGDDEMLKALWPKARKALEFAWIENGWDADRDGVMEGCQHNTTDLDFYGPNPLMAGWYLGALRAAAEMAGHVGEHDFSEECRTLAQRGAQWVDANLFNGEYYIQDIRPPTDAERQAKGTRADCFTKESSSPKDPAQQPGDGCMSDQLAGQFLAHICGLGHLLDEKQIKTTLRAILDRNFITDLSTYENFTGAFALNDEAALVYGTWPEDKRPESPCFRFFENWTGMEYTTAVLMMQEGMVDEGLKIFEAIRARFDGRKRNPFDEPECGHHYARAMASWGAIPALTGFSYSAVSKEMSFALPEGACSTFWSTGHAWGRYVRNGKTARLEVLYGELPIKRFASEGESVEFPNARVLLAGDDVELALSQT